MGLVGGASESEVMPLVNDRAKAEAILRWERSNQVVHRLHESAQSQRWEQGHLDGHDRVLSGVASDNPPTAS